MDTFQVVHFICNLRLKKSLLQFIAFMGLFVWSTVGGATLLKFEFIGSGDLYDYSLNTIDSDKDMSLEFILDTRRLNIVRVGVNDQLASFVLVENISNILLSVNDVQHISHYSIGNLDGFAINDELNFWENSVAVDLDGRYFGISQWIRLGSVKEDSFNDTPNGLLNYYRDMMHSVNGLWRYDMADKNQFYAGALSSFNIAVVQVSEPSSLILLFIGLINLTSRRVFRLWSTR